MTVCDGSIEECGKGELEPRGDLRRLIRSASSSPDIAIPASSNEAEGGETGESPLDTVPLGNCHKG